MIGTFLDIFAKCQQFSMYSLEQLFVSILIVFEKNKFMAEKALWTTKRME